MNDPNQYIITRKRKKYKFALFANSPLCFEFDEWDKTWPADVVEIGAGTGQFVVELAARHPEINYVALDVKGDRLQKGAAEALEKGLSNIRFVRARADQLTELFTANSLREVWLTFSDPFPRKRSAGRRLTHPSFLLKYAQLLYSESNQEHGGLYIKHDSPEFFEWSLEQLASQQWRIAERSVDLHQSDLSSDYKILTSYEKRWLGEGRITQFARAQASRPGTEL